jgi:phage shock protein A
MDIHPAGVGCPHIRFLEAAWRGGFAWVVLFQAQIAHAEAMGAQGPQQLVPVVLQGLEPGAGRCPHGEQAAVQPQGPAVGGELGAGDAGPGLPEGCQVSALLPALLQLPQAAGQFAGRGARRRHQQAEVADLAGLLAGSLGHGQTLSGVRQSRWCIAAQPGYPLGLPPQPPMGFFDRLSRLIRANANAAVGAMEDPAKILDQSVADMQSDLVKLRQAVATAIASQKRIQNQAEQAESQAATWYERAELALKKGEEDLAREALGRRKTCQDTATALNTQLQSQAGQVEQLKKSLVTLESRIAEAKTKKDMLKARAQAAQAQEQLQSAVGSLGTNSSMAAFERMEEKVQTLEARSQAAAELAGADLESQFAALEGAPEVDDELAALKNRLSGGGVAPQLEPVKVSEVDPELEQLKRSIDKL